MTKKKALIDCERMKYPYTGLYEYCSQLSKALLRNKLIDDIDLGFYVPEKDLDFLGKEQEYVIQRSRHKLINPHVSKFDLWHGTFQGTMYYPTQKRIKKLLTIHDLNFLYENKKTESKQRKYMRQLQEKINRSDQLTVISNFTLECIQEHLDLKNIPVQVIYNGCNIDYVKEPLEKPSFINKGEEFLFTVATIAAKKNFHVLPALLPGNNYKLVIAGITQEQKYLDKIIFEAKKHNVLERLIIPGPITQGEKWWLLTNTKAFLFPSIAEGFGMPAVEAMNFGIPIFLSTQTCMPEIGGEAAYYFESFDPDDMRKTFKESLAQFTCDPLQSQKVKERAKMFDWNKTAKAYFKLYNQLTA
ncbi:MAG: glycosyltransferase family 1 protein [Ferruginibacter sp.]